MSRIIDCHIHCGVQHVSWGWEGIRPLLLDAGIQGAGLIPPVEDIYDRYDFHFTDTPAWQTCRRQAHQYLLGLKKSSEGRRLCLPDCLEKGRPLSQPANPDADIETLPYFFVWNDFAYEELGPEFVAVKWHRHANEPEYRYDDARCREFLAAVKARGLPILLEETFTNTLFFLEQMLPDGVPLIIPHLGGLNGGYAALERAGVFALPHVYADTALASRREIEDYISRYGHQRLCFGSDYPFGHPSHELAKILRLNLPRDQQQAVLADNFRHVCGSGK
jgi:uncharacterized protein